MYESLVKLVSKVEELVLDMKSKWHLQSPGSLSGARSTNWCQRTQQENWSWSGSGSRWWKWSSVVEPRSATAPLPVSTGQQLQDQVARSPCSRSSAGKAREVFCGVAFWLASKHPPLLWETYWKENGHGSGIYETSEFHAKKTLVWHTINSFPLQWLVPHTFGQPGNHSRTVPKDKYLQG